MESAKCTSFAPKGEKVSLSLRMCRMQARSAATGSTDVSESEEEEKEAEDD